MLHYVTTVYVRSDATCDITPYLIGRAGLATPVLWRVQKQHEMVGCPFSADWPWLPRSLGRARGNNCHTTPYHVALYIVLVLHDVI